ncbi:MAG: helix-turn-helix transcriptional regulator [Solirubrobacterales bacterium]|nr:helix-turn-helix transcriptional regulator [Solirubrobacterales bacterium]
MPGRPRIVSDAELLDAAARSISRVGPARLTLADVAGEAGVAPATLMQRFGTKRGLLLAFAARAAAGVQPAVRQSRAAHASALDALLDDPLGIARGIRSPEELANHLAFPQLELADPEFFEHALAQAEATRRELRRLLEEAVATGDLRPCDTGRLAEALQVTHNGTLATWAVFGRGRLADALRRQTAHVLAPYLAADPADPARSGRAGGGRAGGGRAGGDRSLLS